MQQIAKNAPIAILFALLLTGCVGSKKPGLSSEPTIPYRQQAGLEKLPSPVLPPVPAPSSGDKALAEFAAGSYAGLLTCKMTIDGHNALLEDVKELAK